MLRATQLNYSFPRAEFFLLVQCSTEIVYDAGAWQAYCGLGAQDLQEAKDQLLVETSDMLRIPLFTAEALLRNHGTCDEPCGVLIKKCPLEKLPAMAIGDRSKFFASYFSNIMIYFNDRGWICGLNPLM